MDKKYILFDLDGTLTDPQQGITKSVAYALEQFGVHVEGLSSLLPFIGPPLIDSFQRFYGFSHEEAVEGVRQYRVYFIQKGGIFDNAVYDGVPEMLEELKGQGKSLILATSKPEPYAIQILEHFDLAGYFDHICGAAMDETRSAKAEVIEYALETAGIIDRSQAVMVGDRKHDIIGAKETGLTSVGVLFGYGDRNELEEAGADYIVRDVSQLGKLLKGENI